MAAASRGDSSFARIGRPILATTGGPRPQSRVADFEDVRVLVPAVLRHRMVLSYAAEADAVSAEVCGGVSMIARSYSSW